MNGLNAHTVLVIAGGAVAVAALYVCWARLRDRPGRRRVALVVLRALVLALVLAAVLDPALSRRARVARPASVLLAVDTSTSMAAPLGDGGTRLAAVLAALDDGPLRDALAQAVVTRYRVAERAEAVEQIEPAPPGGGTDLQAALSEILRVPRAQPPAACLLISDGADSTARPPARVAEALEAYGVPVFCLSVGGEPPADAILAGLVAPRVVVEGEQFEVRVLARARSLRDRPLTLVLRRDDAEVHQEELPAGEAERHARVTIDAGRPGYRWITAEVAPVDGELTDANNLRSTVVRVEPRRARLLLIEGRPRREYAFLRRLLLRIEDLEPVILLRKREPAEFWLDAGEPRRASLSAAGDLSRYRAVILSNIEADALGPAFIGRLADFVTDGGALAMLGGEHSFGAGDWAGSSLRGTLPVGMGGELLGDAVSVRLSGDGELARELRATGFTGWQRLPLLDGMNAVSGVSSGAEVVMEGLSGSAVLGPLVVAGRVGQGRALAVMASDTWRWQQSADADEHSRAGWEALWTTLIGWLIAPRAERQVVIDLGRDSFEAGEPVHALVYVRDADCQPVAGARVEVSAAELGSAGAPVEATATGTPGEYSASFIAGDPGSYQARAMAYLPDGGEIGDRRRFDVTPPIGELADRPRPEVLEAIAAATGGRCLPLERAGEIAELLPLAPVVEERTVELRPARTLSFFLVLLAIAGADWLLRRRWGVG